MFKHCLKRSTDFQQQARLKPFVSRHVKKYQQSFLKMIDAY